MSNLPENWHTYLEVMSKIGGGGCGIAGCDSDDKSCIFRSTALRLLLEDSKVSPDEILIRLNRGVHQRCRANGMEEIGDKIISDLNWE